MAIFYVSCRISNLNQRSRTADVPCLLVDAGRECTWMSSESLERIGIGREPVRRTFVLADGRAVPRDVGCALIRVGTEVTTDEVVFAEPGELELLGARSLEGLRLRVDPIRKMLVPAGPAPAACT